MPSNVTRIETDLYEVRYFLSSMPHLVYTVLYENGKPRVVAREGCTTPEWDHFALSAVRTALEQHTVEVQNEQS